MINKCIGCKHFHKVEYLSNYKDQKPEYNTFSKCLLLNMSMVDYGFDRLIIECTKREV